jgi:hypothetical protein
MNREDIVTVKSSDGDAVAFSAGQKYSLRLAAGELADKWADGSPITRAEFENVLAPHGPFVIAGEIAGEMQLPAANQVVDRLAAEQEE